MELRSSAERLLFLCAVLHPLPYESRFAESPHLRGNRTELEITNASSQPLGKILKSSYGYCGEEVAAIKPKDSFFGRS